MNEFGFVLDLGMLDTGFDEGRHFEVTLKDDLPNHVVHLVELLRLVANGAAAR